MNILFDNNVSDPVRSYIKGHGITFARDMGWDKLENGSLLQAAEDGGFELMITGDKNLSYQQNLKGRRIALIVLGTTHWPTLKENLEPLLLAIRRVKTGSFEELPKPPRVMRKKT